MELAVEVPEVGIALVLLQTTPKAPPRLSALVDRIESSIGRKKKLQLPTTVTCTAIE